MQPARSEGHPFVCGFLLVLEGVRAYTLVGLSCVHSGEKSLHNGLIDRNRWHITSLHCIQQAVRIPT